MIVLLTGKKRSGKDTAAEVFNGYEVLKFAGILKEMTRTFLREQGADEELIERYVEGDLKEVPCPYMNGKTSREFQQKLGTEFGRDMIDPNLWADATMRKADTFDNVVISDMRFPNEAEVTSDKHQIVKIRVNSSRVVDDEFSNHPSEMHIPTLPVSLELENNGTIEEFQTKVRAFKDAIEQ